MKRRYNTIRSHFTSAYDRWSVSGQNDPSSFADFCGLTAIGKRCLVMFTVLRYGHAQEKNELLDFALRPITMSVMGDCGQKQNSIEEAR